MTGPNGVLGTHGHGLQEKSQPCALKTEQREGFWALGPFLPSEALGRGLGHTCRPEGLQGSSEARAGSSSVSLWVPVPGAGAWQGQQSAEAGKMPILL